MFKNDYRRLMDKEHLSDETRKKLESPDFASRRPQTRIRRIRRRRYAGLASIAACFTVICLAGLPLIFGGFGAESADCESEGPEDADAIFENCPNFFFTSSDQNKTQNSGSLGTGFTGYDSIWKALRNEAETAAEAPQSVRPENTDEELLTGDLPSCPETSDSFGDTSDLPSLGVDAGTFRAQADPDGSPVHVTWTSGNSESVIVPDENFRTDALCAYGDLLIICGRAEEPLTLAYIYDLSEVSSPVLAARFTLSGTLVYSERDEDVLTLVTDFTPDLSGDGSDLAAYIPRFETDGETEFAAPENCTLTFGDSGAYRCYVFTDIKISGDPSCLSLSANFTQK